jgi:hypothetical protein
MADSSSANTNSSASQPETVRSSSGTPQQIFRSWARDRASGASKVMQHRISLLEVLTKYVHANGGYVTSPPGQKLITIEISKDSTLPTKLMELGYSPVQIGQTMRTSYRGFELFDRVEISIEK